jgi:hypothetical protein
MKEHVVSNFSTTSWNCSIDPRWAVNNSVKVSRDSVSITEPINSSRNLADKLAASGGVSAKAVKVWKQKSAQSERRR